MDNFPDAAVFPRALAGVDPSERSARPAAAPGPAYLDWIKGAAARSAEALFQGYGPLAALTACLIGLAWLGWSHIPSRAPAQPKAEISHPALATAAESGAQAAADADAMRAAQSLNTVGAAVAAATGPRPEAVRTETSTSIAPDAGKTGSVPPKPIEKFVKGGERVDRIGLKIAALLAAAPVADHSAPAARKPGAKARHDAFDPSLHPNAPGAPRALGTLHSASAKKPGAQYAYGQPAN